MIWLVSCFETERHQGVIPIIAGSDLFFLTTKLTKTVSSRKVGIYNVSAVCDNIDLQTKQGSAILFVRGFCDKDICLFP